VLPIPPLALAAAVVGIVLLVGTAGRRPEGSAVEVRGSAPRSADGGLRPGQRVVRLTVLGVVAGSISVGLTGSQVVTRNPAPLLLAALGWPLVLLAALVGLRPWRWVDPFDTVARILAPDRGAASPTGPAAGSGAGAGAAADAPGGSVGVWPAVPLAAGLTAWVAVVPVALRPRTVALVSAGLLLVVAAGTLALGRRWWLDRAEPVGLLVTWAGLWRGGAAARWSPPAGAGVLLGVVGGGLLVAMVRRTDLWDPLLFAVGGTRADVLGVLAGMVAGAAVVLACDGLEARAGRPGAAVAVLPPVVAALAIVHALVEGRAVVALFSLPHALVDPLGRGWSLGSLGRGTGPIPFGASGVAALQVVVLVLAAVVAASAARRRGGGGALLGIAAWVSAALLVVSLG
jgi:hypothetical protein